MLHDANRVWGVLLVAAAAFGASVVAFLIWQEHSVQGAWRRAALRIDADAADRIADQLQTRRHDLPTLPAEPLDRYLAEIANGGDYQLALLSARGDVIAGTHRDGASDAIIAENRTGVAECLRRRTYQSHIHAGRNSAMETATFRALPASETDDLAALVVRRSRPFQTMAAALGLSMLPAAAFFGLPAFLVLGLFVYRTWTRPLRDLLHAARLAAEGRPTAALRPPEHGELGVLAHAVSRVQRRLQHQIDGLQLERDSVAALLNRLHEGVIVADARGRIALINPAAARLLNLPLDDAGTTARLIGKPVERCISHHEVQRLLHAGRIEPTRTGDFREEAAPEDTTFQVSLPDRKLEIVARAADLRLRSAAEIATRVRSRFVVLTDITELSEALQMKAEFVANASHELRTPLATIRAAVETLLHMNLADEPEDAARFLRLVDRHSTRLSDLVSDLLDLSRIESPEVAHPARTILIAPFLDELADRFGEKLEARGVTLHVAVAHPNGAIVASPYLLQLALDNLVDNAIKFSPAGAEVRLAAVPDATGVAFEVADHGCGIPEADARRVFERFYQVERARGGGEQRGSGLGLAIVKHAAQVLGGSVQLASTVGVGTTVTFRVPLAPPVGAFAEGERNPEPDSSRSERG